MPWTPEKNELRGRLDPISGIWYPRNLETCSRAIFLSLAIHQKEQSETESVDFCTSIGGFLESSNLSRLNHDLDVDAKR
jgi:hypothetical protein